MFKMFTEGQSARIKTILRKYATSHPISAAAHFLSTGIIFRFNYVRKMSAALHSKYNSHLDWRLANLTAIYP